MNTFSSVLSLLTSSGSTEEDGKKTDPGNKGGTREGDAWTGAGPLSLSSLSLSLSLQAAKASKGRLNTARRLDFSSSSAREPVSALKNSELYSTKYAPPLIKKDPKNPQRDESVRKSSGNPRVEPVLMSDLRHVNTRMPVSGSVNTCEHMGVGLPDRHFQNAPRGKPTRARANQTQKRSVPPV